MKIHLGADHRGVGLKNNIKTWLKSEGFEAKDHGALELKEHDDYVDFALKVANSVANDSNSKGILICGSGVGVDVTANKIREARSVLGINQEQVRASRNDDDVNILSIAADYTSFDDAKLLVDAFLSTTFDPTNNHVRRLNKIKELEKG